MMKLTPTELFGQAFCLQKGCEETTNTEPFYLKTCDYRR